MAYATYVLATLPEEQQKLYDEIVSVFGYEKNLKPDADSVGKLNYMELFIKEVLRYYPIGNT